MKRQKRPVSFRTRITRRIKREPTKRARLTELHDERKRIEKRLKKINREIVQQERRERKAGRQRVTQKLKDARARARRGKRQIQSLKDIRKIVTMVKKKLGGKRQRKAQIEIEQRKNNEGQVFGKKKIYEFTHFNHVANYAGVNGYLTGLIKQAELVDIYLTILVLGKLKRVGEGGVELEGSAPVVIKGEGKAMPRSFRWYNLLKYFEGTGVNVDVRVLRGIKIQTMLASLDWSVWRDSGQYEIKTIVLSSSYVQ